jgi:outer membrane protein insertion porin family
MQYYQFNAKVVDYTPMTEKIVWGNKLDLGYAHSYGDDPYPFFQNYYVGGSNSVRGYKAASIGSNSMTSHKKILYRLEVQRKS